MNKQLYIFIYLLIKLIKIYKYKNYIMKNNINLNNKKSINEL